MRSFAATRLRGNLLDGLGFSSFLSLCLPLPGTAGPETVKHHLQAAAITVASTSPGLPGGAVKGLGAASLAPLHPHPLLLFSSLSRLMAIN